MAAAPGLYTSGQGPANTVAVIQPGMQVQPVVLVDQNGNFVSGTYITNPMTALGDMIDGGSSGTPARLAGNTAAVKKFLTQTGTGTTSAAPAWGAIAASDLPSSVPTTGQVLAFAKNCPMP